ncbi:hypothetical protein PUP66_14540 [Pseudomonas chlororaphis]|uniref:hypothetical protein n=1 Tax=Pseudomonas chlororaphis TaxID=587753 RepID=UPI0013B43602|nr:hypothetical protein [Pseudomonas chlororaphis]WDH50050.1 hypothetical protein PUP66_14540 [Pseudomonas chlororaphis]WDH61899.1 hypothetical protein PUP56_14545 [Pseudomonas chlororaphis]WQE21155.1 hypothetical protein U0007_13355 [Pseudomonas chlororaphis]
MALDLKVQFNVKVIFGGFQKPALANFGWRERRKASSASSAQRNSLVDAIDQMQSPGEKPIETRKCSRFNRIAFKHFCQSRIGGDA